MCACHTCAGATFNPENLGGPRGVLQFVNVNMRITRSVFTGITGTPFTLVFNNSNVQIDNTNFESNSGGSLLLRPSLIPLLAGALNAGCAGSGELETIRAWSMVDSSFEGHI